MNIIKKICSHGSYGFRVMLNIIVPSVVKKNTFCWNLFIRESSVPFKILKRSISFIVPKVCQAVIKSLEESIQVSKNFLPWVKERPVRPDRLKRSSRMLQQHHPHSRISPECCSYITLLSASLYVSVRVCTRLKT